MIPIDLLQYKSKLRTKSEGGVSHVFDPVRRKWVQLQPEELVRQLFIQYCIATKLSSINNISIERQISVNSLQRRYDIALHDSQGYPWLLVECKAPAVEITQKSLDQIAHYNSTLKVPYLIVTNGIKTYGCHIDFEHNAFIELLDIPTLKEN